MGEAGTIDIELIEVSGAQVTRRSLTLPAGMLIATLSSMLRGPLGPSGQGFVLARFGKICDEAEPVVAGDCLQWLAPLRVDPKIARFRRVEKRRAQALRNKWSPDQPGGERKRR